MFLLIINLILNSIYQEWSSTSCGHTNSSKRSPWFYFIWPHYNYIRQLPTCILGFYPIPRKVVDCGIRISHIVMNTVIIIPLSCFLIQSCLLVFMTCLGKYIGGFPGKIPKVAFYKSQETPTVTVLLDITIFKLSHGIMINDFPPKIASCCFNDSLLMSLPLQILEVLSSHMALAETGSQFQAVRSLSSNLCLCESEVREEWNN